MGLLRRLRRALSLEDSPIGRGVSRPVGAVMAVLAIAVVLHDMGWFPGVPMTWFGWRRPLPALAAVAVFAIAVRGDRAAIGARLVPLPSLGYWVRATAVLAAIFGVLLAGAFLVMTAMGFDLGEVEPMTDEAIWIQHFEAPLYEEAIYRWALVTGLVAIGPRWLAVVVSGIAFGYLHVLYSTPAINNLTAGFVFAWMYLKSGTIVMPVAFHALGNFTVWMLNVAMAALM